MLVTVSTTAVVPRLATRVGWTVFPLVDPVVVLFAFNKISYWEVVPVLSFPRDFSSAVCIFQYCLRYSFHGVSPRSTHKCSDKRNLLR